MSRNYRDYHSTEKLSFTIDLEPGITRISKTLYRMALAGLEELKVQIHDLLEKEFIRLSISPWGAPGS